MRTFLLSFFLFFILFSCKNISEDIEPYDLINENSKIIISINNLSKFKNSIANNHYFNSIINSNSTLKSLVNDINKIEIDKQIIIGLYGNKIEHYDIIGKKIINDSTNKKQFYSFKNIDIISNNENKVHAINKKHFINKFKKINQNNTNFSIALDSSFTNYFMDKIFDKEKLISAGNLLLNISTSNNLILLDGVIDNCNIKTEDKSRLEEIKNDDKSLYFDFETDLLEEYDALITNQDKEFNFFEFEKTKAKDFKIFQFKNGDNILNINGIISEFKTESNNDEDNLKFEINLANDIILGPIIVKNHINNKNEIIVQDSENKIHLINSDGQVEWTKKINGKILKEIHQIDTYKNGKLQYVFNTENNLFVIDRKGRNVGRFPLKFDDKITKPISIFDYDKNKNYRLLITQNRELFMFDSKGKRVKGFEYKKKSEIITKPKHFRISGKDIIVFKTIDELLILDRRGKIRIKPKGNYNYSNNEIYQHENNLVSTSNKNEIVKINMKGDVKIGESMSFNSKLISSKNLLITLQKNIIANLGKETEIEFGKYDGFKIYNLNKNEFVTVYDSQNKNLYFLDKNLNIQDGFPIYSNSEANFSTYKDEIEFSLKSDDRTIKFYTIK
ncbi:MAG: hypothetical protein ACJ0O0_04175 [Flavobacteriaceae bacterium]|nr:MAG: hypothetical protein DBW76_00455 [Bacteroidota bacterium]